MKKLYFTQNELSIVYASVNVRKKIWLGQPNLIADLDDILNRITSPFLKLKQIQKARLIGCVKNYIIDPNIDLFKLSDYDIFLDYNQNRSLILEIDLGSSIINKLLRKKDKKHRLFKDTIERILPLFTVRNIYYSESYNGNIYKIGLVASNGLIFKTELDHNNIGRIKFEKINKVSFEKLGNINEVIRKLYTYGKENKLTQSQLKIREMLMIISKSKTFKVIH